MNDILVAKIQEETNIIATETNLKLITTFFEANKLIPGVEVSTYRKILLTEEIVDNVYNEKYYNAICIKYLIDDMPTIVLLLNLSSKHSGLENMLIDYLKRLGVRPIMQNMVFTKTPKPEDVNKHFQENIVPKMKSGKLTKSNWRKSYADEQEK